MDSVVRALVIYLFLLVLMRIAGRRTLSDMTTFDLVLLLVISEAVQPGLTGDNYSLTNAMILVLTLVGLDIALSLVKMRLPRVSAVLEGLPTVLVADGRPLEDRMRRARVRESDVLEAARVHAGLARMDQIQYAVLEASGQISIIPHSTLVSASRSPVH
jgi:uncharacterized membrane protein YcaP (DUF421 family)